MGCGSMTCLTHRSPPPTWFWRMIGVLGIHSHCRLHYQAYLTYFESCPPVRAPKPWSCGKQLQYSPSQACTQTYWQCPTTVQQAEHWSPWAQHSQGHKAMIKLRQLVTYRTIAKKRWINQCRWPYIFHNIFHVWVRSVNNQRIDIYRILRILLNSEGHHSPKETQTGLPLQE